jgi:hypothetical protein
MTLNGNENLLKRSKRNNGLANRQSSCESSNFTNLVTCIRCGGTIDSNKILCSNFYATIQQATAYAVIVFG